MKKDNFRVIGVMSGTSLDGIDLVDVSFSLVSDEWQFRVHNFDTINYDSNWEETLNKLTDLKRGQIREIDQNYTTFLAHNIKTFISKFNIEKIDAICSHGHTALHEPENGFTYQIGNLPTLSALLGKKVVCDFRVQDVEYGGQGAPLVPIGDKLLFNSYEYCLNLGGFANISFDQDGQRIAYDICPVNIVLNYYSRTIGLAFDNDGNIAASGKVNFDLLNQLNALGYYRRSFPKSLGLEWVQSEIFTLIDQYTLPLEDVLRTYIEHISVQITNQLDNYINSKVLITGGGCFNSFLISRLQEMSTNTLVIPSDDIINFKEAIIFGFLGVLKLRGETNCLKSVTGAIKDHSSGKIFLP